MMREKKDPNTRYFIDVDVRTRQIVVLDYDHRDKLVREEPVPFHHRVFLSKGQFNKLVKSLEQ